MIITKCRAAIVTLYMPDIKMISYSISVGANYSFWPESTLNGIATITQVF